MNSTQTSKQDSTKARDEILKRIRTANNKRTTNSKRAALADGTRASGTLTGSAAVQEHMQARRTHTLPSWPAPADDTDRLLEQMERVQITVTRVQTQAEVVQVVEEYRREHEIEGPLIVAPSLRDAAGVEWPAGTLSGAARDALPSQKAGDEVTSVTHCFCAVAETGSVVTASDSARPSTLNFLPDNHVVVLHENQIVKHMDDAWNRLRDVAGAASGESSGITTSVPRALNFITGPSRTADIEQTLELGAHGPRKMHVVLVAADAEKDT